MTLEHRPEGSEEMSCVDIWGRVFWVRMASARALRQRHAGHAGEQLR